MSDVYATGCSGWGVRHGVVILGFFLGSLLYSLRFNLSIGIVAMVDTRLVEAESLERTGFNSSDEEICPSLLDSNEDLGSVSEILPKDAPSLRRSDEYMKFDWNERDQGLILGSFFWGYAMIQIPAGLIAQKYGPKWVIGLGLLCTGLLSLVLPQAAFLGGRDLIILVRILQGVGEGLTIPAFFVLLSRWSPPQERGRMSSICFTGMPFGTATTMMLSGTLITKFGWPSVFYLPGFLSLIVFAFWVAKIYSRPEDHPDITLEELNYIQESKHAGNIEGNPSSTAESEQPKLSEVPWKEIFLSVPIWSVFISQFFNAWGHNMLKSEGPKYLHQALHFDIHANGYLSASPYIFQMLFALGVGRLSDYLIENKICSMLTARKLCNTIGQWGSAVAFAGIILAGCNRYVAVFCYIMSGMINGAMLSGCFVNIIDIAPNFSGAIEGVINSAANIAGFGAPFVAGMILYAEPSMMGWNLVFLVPVLSNLVGNLAFILGSSTDVQPWNEVKSRRNAGQDVKEDGV